MSNAQTMIVFECNEEKVRDKEGRSIAHGDQFTVIYKYTCVTDVAIDLERDFEIVVINKEMLDHSVMS